MNGRLPPPCDAMYLPSGSDGAGADRLAAYVREVVRGLAAQDGFERAQLAFPDPEQVLLRA